MEDGLVVCVTIHCYILYGDSIFVRMNSIGFGKKKVKGGGVVFWKSSVLHNDASKTTGGK
jgi:hypothetical protein